MADRLFDPRETAPEGRNKHVYLQDRMDKLGWIASLPNDPLGFPFWFVSVFGPKVRSLFKKLWKR